MYTSIAGSFGVTYAYAIRSSSKASVKLWTASLENSYDEFVMTFLDATSGTAEWSGRSSMGSYGPINCDFERIQ
jgi:hypothetical protein